MGSPSSFRKSSIMMFLLASAFIVVSLLGQVNSAEATDVAATGTRNGTVTDPGISIVNIPDHKLRFEPGPRQHGRANNINDYYYYYDDDFEWRVWVAMTGTGILSIIITVSIAACCFSCSGCPLRRRLDMNQNQNRGMLPGQPNFGYDAYGNRVMLSPNQQQQMVYSPYSPPPQGNVVYQQQQQLPPQQQQQQVIQQVTQPIQAPLGSVVVEPQNK